MQVSQRVCHPPNEGGYRKDNSREVLREEGPPGKPQRTGVVPGQDKQGPLMAPCQGCQRPERGTDQNGTTETIEEA